MYDSLIRWIGSKTCTFAGNLTDVMEVGPVCFRSQAWNMGIVALALVGFSIAVMVINARRRHHRENYYR